MKKYSIVVDLKPKHDFSYQWRIELHLPEGTFTIANGQAQNAKCACYNAHKKAEELGLI